MPRDLIIVESPAKTKTLASLLGKSYDIRATMGHVRDLPKRRLGVNTERRFEPSYEIIPERREIIEGLQKAAKGSRQVYLASDPDREGEAIAWHLAEVLGVPNAQRIEFNEITQRAVREALEHPRTIHQERVNAQQARRVLDRLVGYKLSPLLCKKVQSNLSAGRVQSVAVRLIVDREREIQAFVPEEYWSITARLTPQGREQPFAARLVQVDGKKAEIRNREEADAILRVLGHELVEQDGEFSANLAGTAAPRWEVGPVQRKEQRRNPQAPFTTSTLQQEAARKLGFSSRRTMQVAQQLYEGIDLGTEGHAGLITYMRTDSVHIAVEAQAEARDYIGERYGAQYVPKAPRRYKAAKSSQEAHEAIRPTSVLRHPDQLRQQLSGDLARLYTLIWQRFLASQMESAVFDVTTVDIPVANLLFRATGRVMKFDGYMAVYIEGRDEDSDEEDARRLPNLATGDLLDLLALLPGQHFTEPPPRYTEATLVKALEERGIGRPSTYAQIISTIQDRNYVVLAEKRFRPTDLGCVVTDQLVQHFPKVLNIDFTAEVEQELDDIASGERDWVEVLAEFYGPFQEALGAAEQGMERVKPEAVPSGMNCPECQSELLIRMGRRGRFLGCSAFPKCKKTMPHPEDEVAAPSENGSGPAAAEPAPECPKCGRPMQRRQGRFGEFFGCSGYPECKTIVDPKRTEPKAIGVPCPTGCGGQLQEKRSRRGKVFYGCDRYPACTFAAWDRPTDQKCETCGYPMGERAFRGQVSGLRCTNEGCPTYSRNGKNGVEPGESAAAAKKPARKTAAATAGRRKKA
jgi:DNA topoisomerase-1